VGTVEARRTPKEARDILAQRRAAAHARATDAIDVLRTAADRHRHQAALDALNRILLTGRTFRFDILAQILEPQPWVVNEHGQVLGHVLTVDAAVLDHAADCELFEVMTLPDVLVERQWLDIEARMEWGRAYAAALRAIAETADGATQAAWAENDLRRRLAEPNE